VTKRPPIRVLDDIIAGGAPFGANRALAAIKKLFAWSLDRGLIEINPIAGIKPPTKERSRDRVLTDQEVSRFCGVTGELGYPFGPLLHHPAGNGRGEPMGRPVSSADIAGCAYNASQRGRAGRSKIATRGIHPPLASSGFRPPQERAGHHPRPQLPHPCDGYPALALAEARELAQKFLGEVQAGKYDEPDQKTPTLGETVPEFIERYARPKNRGWRESERILTKFSRLYDRPLDHVKRTEVRRRTVDGHSTLMLASLSARR
jgi:hypothetical protein